MPWPHSKAQWPRLVITVAFAIALLPVSITSSSPTFQEDEGLRVRLAKDHLQYDGGNPDLNGPELAASAVSPFCKSFAFLCHVRCLQQRSDDTSHPPPAAKPKYAGRGELNRCAHVPNSDTVHLLCICDNGVDLTAEIDYALEGIVDIAATGDQDPNGDPASGAPVRTVIYRAPRPAVHRPGEDNEDNSLPTPSTVLPPPPPPPSPSSTSSDQLSAMSSAQGVDPSHVSVPTPIVGPPLSPASPSLVAPSSPNSQPTVVNDPAPLFSSTLVSLSPNVKSNTPVGPPTPIVDPPSSGSIDTQPTVVADHAPLSSPSPAPTLIVNPPLPSSLPGADPTVIARPSPASQAGPQPTSLVDPLPVLPPSPSPVFPSNATASIAPSTSPSLVPASSTGPSPTPASASGTDPSPSLVSASSTPSPALASVFDAPSLPSAAGSNASLSPSVVSARAPTPSSELLSNAASPSAASPFSTPLAADAVDGNPSLSSPSSSVSPPAVPTEPSPPLEPASNFAIFDPGNDTLKDMVLEDDEYNAQPDLSDPEIDNMESNVTDQDAGALDETAMTSDGAEAAEVVAAVEEEEEEPMNNVQEDMDQEPLDELTTDVEPSESLTNFKKRHASSNEDALSLKTAAAADQALQECSAAAASLSQDYTHYMPSHLQWTTSEAYCSAFVKICPAACQLVASSSHLAENVFPPPSQSSWGAECAWDVATGAGAVDQANKISLSLVCRCDGSGGGGGGAGGPSAAEDWTGTCLSTHLLEAALAGAQKELQSRSPGAAAKTERPGAAVLQVPSPFPSSSTSSSSDAQETPAQDNRAAMDDLIFSSSLSSSGSMSAFGNIELDAPTNGSDDQSETKRCERFATLCEATCHILLDTTSLSSSAVATEAADPLEPKEHASADSLVHKRLQDDAEAVEKQGLGINAQKKQHSHRHHPRSQQRHSRRHKRLMWFFAMEDETSPLLATAQVTCLPLQSQQSQQQQQQQRQCLCHPAAVDHRLSEPLDLTKAILQAMA